MYNNYIALVIITKSTRGGELNEVMSEVILNKVAGTLVPQVKREKNIFTCEAVKAHRGS